MRLCLGRDRSAAPFPLGFPRVRPLSPLLWAVSPGRALPGPAQGTMADSGPITGAGGSKAPSPPATRPCVARGTAYLRQGAASSQPACSLCGATCCVPGRGRRLCTTSSLPARHSQQLLTARCAVGGRGCAPRVCAAGTSATPVHPGTCVGRLGSGDDLVPAQDTVLGLGPFPLQGQAEQLQTWASVLCLRDKSLLIGIGFIELLQHSKDRTDRN